ncbi:type IV toxin-antitoxin system AbiEi family antitoxin domain-containing protein [Brachybacterium hainanense]|uniref:Type IV toxin-antitoxin system AbiEi family antitoxin domain-containing protein n=1 Tax=Brachybacterium hainanense TaxID=1541174 RepID=A0ABV6RDX4_9MICO
MDDLLIPHPIPHDAPELLSLPHLHLRTRPELAAMGMSTRQLDRKLAAGEIIRLAHGIYGTSQTPGPIIRALQSRQLLTCISALSLLGFWQIRDEKIHVAQLRAGSRSARARHRSGVVLHDPAPRRIPGSKLFVPVPDALEHVIRCRGVEDGAIELESGLRRGLITRDDVEQVRSALPLRLDRALGELRCDADAGTETKTRRFFERRGVEVRAQVEFLDGMWRVDLLVGDCLVVECDSLEFHTGVEEYDRTYRKRLDLQALGMVYVQLTYEQVMIDWERTSRMLGAMLDRREHRTRRRTVA